MSVLVLVSCGEPRAVQQPQIAASIPTVAAAPPAPEREDFEAATLGSLPAGWIVPGEASDVTASAVRGDSGVVLQVVATDDAPRTISRPLDLARYRGKRVLLDLRGSLAAKQPRARATVGVNVAHPGPRGYGDRARTDRIDSAPWKTYRTIVDVARDATGLDLVINVAGASTTSIDDIQLSVLGVAGAGDEPPRALEGRALDNVVAFARLYGVVRYFHPSDQAAALDDAAWQRFLVNGVRAVERAPDARALKTAIEQLFAPVAPAVAIYLDGQPAPAIQEPAGDKLHWSHTGIGISPGSAYRSQRSGQEAPIVTTITVSIDPALVRGKAIEVRLRGRGALTGADADAGLWIAETKADGSGGFYGEPEQQPALGSSWTDITVQGRVSADAAAFRVGIQTIGAVDVWLEPPVVTADGRPVAIAGWGPPGTELASQWSQMAGGGDVVVADRGCAKGRSCLHVNARPRPTPDRRPWTGALGSGVAAMVPLELTTEAGKTLPVATAALPKFDAVPLVASDRATRLAAVIIAWNVFEHFYPYFDVVGTDWAPELPRRLAEAARDDGTAALHATLRRMIHELHDGHGSVTHPSEDRSRIAPWLWERIEGKLAITQVADRCACDLKPGDIVTAIDGTEVDQVIAAAAALDSAATDQFRTYEVLRMLRAGPEAGRRTLTIVRDGVSRKVEIALVETTPVIEDKHPVSGAEIAPGIRYVDIDRVTVDQWKAILPDLAAAKGVVVDIRGYPNRIPLNVPLAHFTKQRLRSAQWHIPTPARPDRDGMSFSQAGWTIEPEAPFIANVVFLTDGRAVSAAETFMGIVEHGKLGPIVGSTTAGTNGNINPFSLPGGYQLWWTGMRVLKQDGSRHHGVGIRPTVPATRTLAGVAAGRDEILEKGIEIAQRPAGRRKPR